MQIGIVDYGMGNLRSVANAFESLGFHPAIAGEPAQLREAERIVLPGVGAFGDGIDNLRAGGWVEVLEEEVLRRGKPLLGLCLGMQLLASRGTEHGDHEGLGWIEGTTRRLRPSDPAIRIPHIGWNNVEVVEGRRTYAGAKGEQSFYFVHSYVFEPADQEVVSGWCEHGERFAASIERDNILATQFHPEKSQKCGLAVLARFMQS